MQGYEGTFTGNGTTQSITGVGFQPDRVWFQNDSRLESSNWYAALGDDELVAQTGGDDLWVASGGVTPEADGFSVGSHGHINGNGDTIRYFAELDD